MMKKIREVLKLGDTEPSPEQALIETLKTIRVGELRAFCEKNGLELSVRIEDPYLDELNGDSCPGIEGGDEYEDRYYIPTIYQEHEKRSAKGLLRAHTYDYRYIEATISRNKKKLCKRTVEVPTILQGWFNFGDPTMGSSREMDVIEKITSPANEAQLWRLEAMEDLYDALELALKSHGADPPLLQKYIRSGETQKGLRSALDSFQESTRKGHLHPEEKTAAINELQKYLFPRGCRYINWRGDVESFVRQEGMDLRGTHPHVVIARLLKRLTVIPSLSDVYHHKEEKILYNFDRRTQYVHYPCFRWMGRQIVRYWKLETLLSGKEMLTPKEEAAFAQKLELQLPQDFAKLKEKLTEDIHQTLKRLGWEIPEKRKRATYR